VISPTNSAEEPNCLYLNDGTGVFSDALNQIPSHISRTYATAMGDVDDDGDLDVFVGNHSSPNQLYLNDGTGWFTDATNQIPDHDNSTTAAVFGDVDGDGDLDVLLGNYWMRDQLYLNDGTGCFIDATSQFPDSGAKTEDMEIGDVDGDDDLDVLIGTEYQAFLLLNDGTGLFSDATDQLPDGNMWYYDVVLADLDGDDDLDALIGTISQNRILLNNGAGLFSDYTSSISPDSHSASSVALGDLDGDGDLDAVVGNWDDHYFSYGEPNHVYINDGLGRWRADPDRIPEIDEDTTVVALGDVDSDGDLDLFVGNDDWPNSCRLYMNNGKGWFFDASKLLPEGDHTLCAAFGDVDGDGDLDIFCGTSYWDDYLYLNNGNGGFFDASRRLPSHWDRTMAAAFGDVDGDNDLDLFISDDAYGRNRLYLNDGNGLFSDATNQIPPAGYDDILSIALGDVDNDGDLDAFLASDEDRLYLNDGTGWFSDATSQIPIDNEESHSVALGDVDNDGDLDAIMGNYDAFHYPREINLYLNDGQGHFVDASHLVSWNGGITFALALGDLDGDGDLDVFTGKRYQDRLFFNLTNHLACRGVPRVGKPFSMEVCGPPNGWYILAASTHSDNVPMPPLGDLRILLDGVIYRSSDSLDSEGRAVLEFEVPPFPAIVGKRLYWQAFVWNPGHFTNLEVTTLTDL